MVAIGLVTLASPVTNWSLVEQTSSFLTFYSGGPSRVERVVRTFTSLIGPANYLPVALAGLTWLSLHTERRSNVARIVLIAGGLAAMLIGARGFPHYLILWFGAVGLAATMPLKPDARLFPQRLSLIVLAAAVAILAAFVLVSGYITDTCGHCHPVGPSLPSPPIPSIATPQWPVLVRPGRQPWSGAGRPKSTSDKTGRALSPIRPRTGWP